MIGKMIVIVVGTERLKAIPSMEDSPEFDYPSVKLREWEWDYTMGDFRRCALRAIASIENELGDELIQEVNPAE